MKTINLQVSTYGHDDTIDFARAIVHFSPEREALLRKYHELALQAAGLSRDFSSITVNDYAISRMDGSGGESEATATNIRLEVSKDSFWWSGDFKHSHDTFETQPMSFSEFDCLRDDDAAAVLPVDCRDSFSRETASGMLNPANGRVSGIDEGFGQFDEIVLPDGQTIDVAEFDGAYYVVPEEMDGIASLDIDCYGVSSPGM